MLVLLALVSCGDSLDGPRLGQTIFEGPIDQSELLEGPDGSTMLAVDAENQVVLFDVHTGDITARSESPLAKLTAVTDLVFDPYAQRVLAARTLANGAQPSATPSGIEAISVVNDQGPWLLGEPRLQLASGGPVRLMPVPAGLVMFESKPERWSFVGTTAVAPSFSIEAPPPASLWAFVEADGGLHLNALSSLAGPTPRLQWARARVGKTLSELPAKPLQGELPHGSSSPRMAWSRHFGAPLLVGLSDGVLSGALVDGNHLAGWELPRQLSSDLGGGRIEHIEALTGPGQANQVEHFAVLLSMPARLVVVALDERVRSRVFPLEGSLHRHQPFFGRNLLARGGRILIALREGLVALRWRPVSFDAPFIERDERFDGSGLRGPLAGPLPRFRPNP